MTDKLIVTNKSALRAKYGAAGLRKVTGAVATLVAADRKRGLIARLVDLSSATTMKRLNAPVVTATAMRRSRASWVIRSSATAP